MQSTCWCLRLMRAVGAAWLVASALSGCAALDGPSDLGWTVEKFAAAAKVNDDPMNTFIAVRSDGPRTHSPGSDMRSQLRLAAVIDRRTRRETIMVNLQVNHSRSGWLFPRSASYLGPDGAARDARGFERGRSDVSCSGRYSCDHDESAFFLIGRDELERLVTAGPAPRVTRYWAIRFNTERGPLDYVMPLDEIEGFLITLHQAQQRLRPL